MDSWPCDTSAADSTAELLQDLHIVGTNRHAKMDIIEMDLVMEVPDTPDRHVMRRPVKALGGSDPNQGGEKASSSNALDNEDLFRKARLASLISKPRDAELHHVEKKFPFGIPYPTRRRTVRRKMGRDLHGGNKAGFSDRLKGVVPNGIAKSLELSDGAHGAEELDGIAVASAVLENGSTNRVAESNHEGNKISLASDSQVMIEKESSNPSPRRFERRKLVRNGLISPTSIKEKFPSVNEVSSSSCVGRNALDKGKGIDLSENSQNKSELQMSQPCHFDIACKNSGQRGPVQHGCISITRDRNLTYSKRGAIGKVDSCEVRDPISLPQSYFVCPDSKTSQADEMKEKVFPNDVIQANGRDANSTFMSSRELLLHGKEKTISEKVQLSSQETSVVLRRKNDSLYSSNQQHESVLEDRNMNVEHPLREADSLESAGSSSFTHESNLSQVQGSSEINFALNPDNERHYVAERLTRGKRKSSSNHAILGECSSSAITDSDASHRQSSGGTSIARSTRGHSAQCHGVTLEPIIDVDGLPSPVLRSASHHDGGCTSSESVARAQQVESDEMLARQLQEQFLGESPSFGGSEEIDATIAWTLQQEEDAQHTSFLRNHGQSHNRSPSIAHLYRQYPRRSSQNSSVQSTTRARMTPSTRTAQLRRNVRRDMDLEARLNYLEALEVAFDNGNDIRSDILHVQRDFNENDYEMLLALDDDNYRHTGASNRQINSLPQSVIQADNVEEACAICLEKPSIGDTIRHLPCLHKFHKDCVDTWLRRRTSCPVCKSEIT